MSELVKDGVDKVWPEFPDQLRAIAGHVAGKHSHTSASVKILFAANQIEWHYKRIAELESSLADSNEALQILGLKLAQAEGHSSTALGVPTPVTDSAPACEQLLADYRNGVPIKVSPETRALAEQVVASKSVLEMSEQELRDWAHRMTHRSNEDTRTTGESDRTSDSQMNKPQSNQGEVK